jgi:hypothetical protein
MRTRKKNLSQSDLRALGARPGLLVTRYGPDGERAEVRRLTAESASARVFSHNSTNTDDITNGSEGGRA